MEDIEKVAIETLKDQFVAVEYELALKWSHVLENECKGTCWVYVQLQTGINRDPSNSDYGKSWLSMAALADRCGATRQWISERIKVLEKYHFIKIRKSAQMENNVYTVMPIPSYSDYTHKNTSRLTDSTSCDSVIQNVFNDAGKSQIFDNEPLEDILLGKAKAGLSELENKDIGLLKQNDFVNYFIWTYTLHFKLYYPGKINAEDRIIMSKFIKEYGAEMYLKMVDYAIMYWSTFSKGYPVFRSMFGCKARIIPEITLGKLSKRSSQHNTERDNANGMVDL